MINSDPLIDHLKKIHDNGKKIGKLELFADLYDAVEKSHRYVMRDAFLIREFLFDELKKFSDK